MTRALGYKRDPHSPADFTFSAGPASDVPSSADLSDLVPNVLDQGQLGSCVANAGMQAIRMSQIREGAKGAALGSRLFGYYFARAIDGTTQEDAGTHPRSFFRAVNRLGFPPDNAWPYSDDPDTFRTMPPFSAMHAAFDAHSPTSYIRIVGEGDAKLLALKKALAARTPVVFGCAVDEAFCQGDFDAKAPLAPVSEASAVGGHCMTFAGYDGDTFKVLNSWSSEWGDGGYCLFSPEYVLDCTDLWIVNHAPLPGEK